MVFELVTGGDLFSFIERFGDQGLEEPVARYFFNQII